MKILSMLLVSFFAVNASAASVCTGLNTQTRVAREAVKSLVALSGALSNVEYWGGVKESRDGKMIVRIEPHFESSKDLYDVEVRISDCRVLKVELLTESLPL